MEKYTHFPLFVDLRGKEIVFVGGGHIAERRVKVLVCFEGHITVIAKEASAGIKDLAARGIITLKEKAWEPEDIDGAHIVLACTNDRGVNEAVIKRAAAAGILYNNSQDHEQCSFYFPGVVTHDHTVVGVTASGKDHRLARQLREDIAELLEKR